MPEFWRQREREEEGRRPKREGSCGKGGLLGTGLAGVVQGPLHSTSDSGASSRVLI